MKKNFNRKHFLCKICKKPHYALHFCQSHYMKFKQKRPLIPIICKWDNCLTKVYSHKKEKICGKHWIYYILNKNKRYKNDGGKWGYKDYRTIQKYKKDKCEICNSKKNIILHHIDGNTRNSNINNLKTLCQKCHLSKTIKRNYKYNRPLQELAKENNCSVRSLYNRKIINYRKYNII